MDKINKKRFIIGFLIAIIGVLYLAGSITLISVSMSLVIGLIVGFIYGKYNFWSF